MQMQNKGTPGLLVYYYDPQGIGHEQDIPEDKFFTGRIISVNDQTQTVDIKRDSDAQVRYLNSYLNMTLNFSTRKF